MENEHDSRKAQMRGGSVVHAVRKNRNVLFSEIVSCRDFMRKMLWRHTFRQFRRARQSLRVFHDPFRFAAVLELTASCGRLSLRL